MVLMQETDSGFRFTERLSFPMRIGCFIFSLLTLLTPYQLLIRTNWINGLWIIFALLSLGAFLMSWLLFGMALFGRDQQVAFDRVQRNVRLEWRTAVSALRTQQFPFHMIKSVSIQTNAWENRADTYSLQLTLNKQADPITFGHFEAEEEAQTQLLAIQKMLYLS